MLLGIMKIPEKIRLFFHKLLRCPGMPTPQGKDDRTIVQCETCGQWWEHNWEWDTSPGGWVSCWDKHGGVYKMPIPKELVQLMSEEDHDAKREFEKQKRLDKTRK